MSTPQLTYEAAKAHESNQRLADPIHWRRDAAYRDQPYRYLHHQTDGIIGHFDVRLVEARALRRSYWSALAMGPVKMLGLSKAHGAVSSFCTLSLGFADQKERTPTKKQKPDTIDPDLLHTKPPAREKQQQQQLAMAMDTAPSVTSPIIPQNDNPVWPDDCQYRLNLRKGSMPKDGQRVLLHVRVEEETTAAEHMLPGMPSGGDSKLLGMGTLDVTSLCLGQTVETAQPQVGILDAWIPIQLADKDGNVDERASLPKPPKTLDDDENVDMDTKPSAKQQQSRVRIVISYKPNGMAPHANDVVAFEAFARRRPENASCRPILPPLAPLIVRKVSGPWILVEYEMNGGQGQKGNIRVHRNTVFVIERKNIVDETIHLALIPADILKNTPLGRSVEPLITAGRQLLMPAMLSAKLMWMALRTTTLASLTGVHAASTALWSEGSNSLTNDGEEEHRRRRGQRERESNHKFISL